LDSEEDLFDGDSGLPGLFLVEDRKTDGAGRVDVRVEERWGEFAWMFVRYAVVTDIVGLSALRTLGRLSRVLCKHLSALVFTQLLLTHSKSYHRGTALRA
jgi:hypothetical protein